MLVFERSDPLRENLQRLIGAGGWTVRAVGILADAMDSASDRIHCALVDFDERDGQTAKLVDALRANNPKAHLAFVTSDQRPSHLAALRAKYRPNAVFNRPPDIRALVKFCDQAMAQIRAGRDSQELQYLPSDAALDAIDP
jgi:hypothetical protein